MQTQFVKSLVRLVLLLAIVSTVSVMSAKAQSLEQRLKVNVPFDFNVGDRQFSAGEYFIQRAGPDSGDTIIRVSSFDGRSSTVRITFPIAAQDLTNKGKLIFHRYGSQYFLTEVWPAGAITGRGLPQSKSEQTIVKNVEDQGWSTVTVTLTMNRK
jgi:hypothetical protein